MGNSQQAGWCKKPASPMKTRAALEVVRSTTWTVVLLTSTAVTGATGINRVSAHLGHSAVMTCPNKTNITMVTWKISPKTGGQCTFAYLIGSNKREKTNCSDRINWRSRPDWDHALEIQQVGMADEGNYTCEVVNADGNFHGPYHLTVQGINRVSAPLGHSAVMTCPNKTNITMVTWKISPKTGGQCILAHLIGSNKTEKTNCSDRINWRSRPDWDHALEIQQVGMADEGNYTCEVVNADGNFHGLHHLTVQATHTHLPPSWCSAVSPRMALYCDDHGNPVCEAETEKPAAEISWVPQSNSTPRADSHSNGTVTVLSRFAAHSSDGKNPTCIVSHTTLNEAKSIDCSSPHRYLILCIAIVLSFLIIITFAAVIYYLKLHGYRFCRKTKPPDIVPTYSLQDDTVEVEPYTTYVQKENAIYNSVSDLTLRQNLPQGQSPAT
ncbi:cell surface glycoprotein CD200 receptor 1 isoform X1 [Tympanuchus pallidicinctus]|uniref:cell surface glycoprotein CD200 receptor 1 isoform X1 n=1 Tax=Tympanuchus pallidicinctus TaxID=109042 RepID=UPI0022870816|nr:cell surface glycoprotein CD200 receptor 1 isoform X1 [Tympanuchus pallidicinctus]